MKEPRVVIRVGQFRNRSIKWAVGAGLVLTGVAAGIAGTAYASAGAPAQRTIYGCYTPSNGALSIRDRDTGRTCKRGQRPISWNKQGAPGLQGPPGPSTAGPSGLDVIYVQGPTVPGLGATATVGCPADHPYAVSGGGTEVNGSGDAIGTQPVDDPNGPAVGAGQMNSWKASVSDDATIYAYVLCAK